MNEIKSLVNISHVDLEAFRPEDTNTSDFTIIDRRVVEMPPRESANFGGAVVGAPGGVYANLTNKTVFNLSDGSGYLDLKKSYFTGQFEAVATTNADVKIESCLDKGGIHSCIREIRMKIGNTEIFRQRYYNKTHNMTTFPIHSEDHVDFMEVRHFDSVEDFGEYRNEVIPLPPAAGGYAPALDADGVINALANNANSVAYLATLNSLGLRVGDTLRINGLQEGVVRAIGTFADAANGTITIGNADATFTAIAGNAANKIEIVRKRISPTRSRVINSGQHRFVLRLDQDFLQKMFYLPLPFMLKYGPCEIEIYWEDAVQSMVLNSLAGVANNKIAYRVSDLKLHASMVYPSQEILSSHSMLYESDKGILIPYVRYDNHEFILTDGVNNLNIQTNKNSIQRVVAAMIDTNLGITGDAKDSQIYFSNSTFRKRNLTSYQFKVGASQFPDYSSVDAAGLDNWITYENLQQAMRLFNRSAGKYSTCSSSRIKPEQWAPLDSDKFILAVPFSKNGDFYDGVSARLNNLQINLNVTNGANHTLLCAVYYDTLLKISKSTGLLVFE